MQRSERDKLIEDNIKLVYFVLNKYYPTYIHDEDIIQIGMIGLCKAADKYDGDKGTFSTYAVIVIQNEIRREFRNRQKEDKLNAVSLDLPVLNDDGKEITTLLDTIMGQEDVGFVDIEGYYKTLKPIEKTYFDLLREGYKPKEVAEILGCSKHNVSRYIRRLKAKWRLFNGD